MKPIWLICAFLLLTISNATCRAGFGDLNPRFDFSLGDSSGMPDDVTDTTGQITSPDGKSVKLFGTMGPLDGARFRHNFVFYYSGTYEGRLNAGSGLEVDLDFVVDVTGGGPGVAVSLGPLERRIHSHIYGSHAARVRCCH